MFLLEALQTFRASWRSEPLADWLELRCPVAGDATPELDEMVSPWRRELLERCRHLARRCLARQCIGLATLRAWTESRHTCLELACEGRIVAHWYFIRRPGYGSGICPRHRGRRVLPAMPHCEPSGAIACVVSSNPATAEALRPLRSLRLDLWVTASPRLARLWLARHPDCPLVISERENLSFQSPARPGVHILLELPSTTQEILAAARKICRSPASAFPSALLTPVF